MKFSVYRDKNCLMSTESADAMYDDELLRSMSKMGYIFKIDSKAVPVKKLIEILSENRKK